MVALLKHRSGDQCHSNPGDARASPNASRILDAEGGSGLRYVMMAALSARVISPAKSSVSIRSATCVAVAAPISSAVRSTVTPLTLLFARLNEKFQRGSGSPPQYSNECG